MKGKTWQQLLDSRSMHLGLLVFSHFGRTGRGEQTGSRAGAGPATCDPLPPVSLQLLDLKVQQFSKDSPPARSQVLKHVARVTILHSNCVKLGLNYNAFLSYTSLATCQTEDGKNP